ncbi:MAG: WXG100 family type VII secretion target [Mycobacterium sp.]
MSSPSAPSVGPSGSALSTDFGLMHAAAEATDTRCAEIRALLQGCIGRLSSVPPSVWGGAAATRFRDVVDRWNAESVKLCHSLDSIAATIRHNEQTLREAGRHHAQQIAAVSAELRTT